MEVGTLARGVKLPLLSVRLPNGIRFFHHPVPAFPSVHFTANFPTGRSTGLPCSVPLPEWVRFSLSAGSVGVHDKAKLNPCARYAPFGSSQQHLGLVVRYDV